jgi:hypothetical protein
MIPGSVNVSHLPAGFTVIQNFTGIKRQRNKNQRSGKKKFSFHKALYNSNLLNSLVL